MLSKYQYHLSFVFVVSIVTLIINVFAFYTKSVSDYLYIFDMAYVVGNSAHFVALSISSSGISIEDEKKSAYPWFLHPTIKLQDTQRKGYNENVVLTTCTDGRFTARGLSV